MTAPLVPHILLTGTAPPWLGEVRPVLEQAVGATVEVCPLESAGGAELERFHLLVVAAEGSGAAEAVRLFRRWRALLGETFVPMLWLGGDRADLAGALETGATAALARPFSAEDLAQQALALLRAQWLFSRAAGRAAEAQKINQQLRQVYQQVDADLEMARHIHRGFLPKSLPEPHRARFAVCYRPRSRVGGDFFDVTRLDEEHAGLWVADAMGQGVPASSLLTLFLKKSIHLKEIVGRSYRLIPPDEVLQRVNYELLALGLPDPPFVTIAYAQLNCRDGLLTYSRAGHPPPLFLPSVGPPEYWSTPGPLLGVFEAQYQAQTQQLQPGDRLLLYTDGAHGGDEELAASARLLDAADRHRAQPLQTFVDALTRDLLEHARQPDDLTLLAVEMQ